MSNTKFITFASVISEIEQSDLFMTVKARILETPKANLNGCKVTEAFVDDIIANKERYVGLPLYADKKALVSGNYNRLGHLYDSKTGEFHSTQIGSFYEFEKETFKNGCYLVGYARIPKRDKALSKAIAELFTDGKLKFSFEIACGEFESYDDGTIEIDASENNYLEGTAIVTFPACEDAVALEFVAQRKANDIERGDEDMAEENKVVAEETVETAVEPAEATPQTAEEQHSPEEAAEENAECGKEKEKAEETAQVYVTESHTERVDTYLYDTETDKNVHQSIEIQTDVSQSVDGNIVEADDGVHIAENEGGDTPDSAAPVENPESDSVDPVENKESDSETPSAEQQETSNEEPAIVEVPSAEVPAVENQEGKRIAETIASLVEAVAKLTAEVKEMKEEQKEHHTASRSIVAETVNPFIDDMSANGNKYSLLEVETHPQTYSLLSR